MNVLKSLEPLSFLLSDHRQIKITIHLRKIKDFYLTKKSYIFQTELITHLRKIKYFYNVNKILYSLWSLQSNLEKKNNPNIHTFIYFKNRNYSFIPIRPNISQYLYF